MILRDLLGIDLRQRISNRRLLFSQQSQTALDISDSEFDDIVRTHLNDLDPDREDPDDEKLIELVNRVADDIFDEDVPVQRAEKARFFNCVSNKWSANWVNGLARETNTVAEDDVVGKAYLRMKGCVGMTSSTTSDDERLIPEEFKD